MNTRITSVPLEKQVSAAPKKVSLLRVGGQVINTIFSMIIAIFAAIFFMWINGKQHEFDQLRDESQQE